MRVTIAIFATLLTAFGAFAQQGQTGPFTRQEADLLSSVWPQIREAPAFEEIDWEAVGLARAPGGSEARRLMATHWDSLRSAARFSDIDWHAITEYPPTRRGQQDRASVSDVFTAQEAEQMSKVWPEIRQAAAFEEIDWQSVGLPRAPGDRETRRVMAAHWDTLRRAAEFSDIDWEATIEYRAR